ncbi:hypothetical protein [Streptomyces sp. NPDC002122]|uniref:hypothetical protein n=1 Tax=Streptomyces sp. NPDC002122 TaxID=3154407 RepID=UPI00332E507A
METRISDSGLSDKEKAEARKSLDSLLVIVNDKDSTQEQKDTAAALARGMGEALNLSQDTTLSKEDRARYARIALGVSLATQKFTDPNASIGDQLIYGEVLENLNVIISNLSGNPELDAESKAFYSQWADVILGGVLAVQQPGTAPTNPEDKKKIQEQLQKNAAALKTYQSASASESDRAAAKATLDEQAAATTNSQYQALVEELKRLKAPQTCLDAVQNRTQQAGWPDGSLWGLTDKDCADTVKAGAADSSSDWSALFECVLNEPFSTCAPRIPE